jgi:hypothetical protein
MISSNALIGYRYLLKEEVKSTHFINSLAFSFYEVLKERQKAKARG